MLGVTSKELQDILGQLEQAIRSHEEWFESLNRLMLCRLPYDLRDVREDAHKECRFGQWLYRYANPKLREHPAFSAIEEEHKRMHQAAAKLLFNVQETGTTPADDYDRFANALQRLRLEINTLKRELENAYYNLDSLTGANSRIGMLTHLREQQELVNRGAQSFSLAMMDLDHFKHVNDAYGHLVGDSALTHIARYILDSIRPYDKLFRYGGEEFLLAMPHTDSSSALPITERLREGISCLDIPCTNADPIHITACFGIAMLEQDEAVEKALERADQALYVAKTQGRNLSKVWSAKLIAAKESQN
jgi:diguanylate cyclase (GGDEF)-like protein